MSDSANIDIRIDNHQMVVVPSTKVINRRRSARHITAKVAAALAKSAPTSMTDVVMDLSDVAWISSAGLNELIQLQAHSRASGINFRLRSTTETVREVFRITRLERIFEFDLEPSAASMSSATAD